LREANMELRLKAGTTNHTLSRRRVQPQWCHADAVAKVAWMQKPR
jgi:hypothetical protein